jgi:molybdenum cofactor guanylyltransferase
MGLPKALLQIDGKPILQWILQQLQWPGPTMLVTAPAVANPPGSEHFGSRVVDPEDGLGPLRGVLTALENLATPTMAVIPVDMPNIDRNQLLWLLDRLSDGPEIFGLICRSQATRHIEAFPSAFRAAAKPVIAARLAAGRRSVRELLDDPSFVLIDAPDWWAANTWTNLNDPESLRRFQAARKRST